MIGSARIRTVRVCARQELLLAVRSRWLQSFAAAFAVLALAVAASGYILSGGSGLQDFGRTAASLLQLVLLLVPLASLILGVLAITPDRGNAELLYAQPVDRRDVLIGTLAGLFAALVAAQAIGFGAAGAVIFAGTGTEGLAGFFTVWLGAAVLTAVFLALAALVAAGHVGRRRARALATALILWFVLALLVDVVALGAASLLRSGHASRLLIMTVLLNPVGAVRTGALLAIEGTAAFGAASLALLRFTNGIPGAVAAVTGSLLLWIALPAFAAARRLARIDIA
jgi:Cu-processing system permease protein